MALSKEDFTSSETINSFERGDYTIEIVGYTAMKENNANTSSKSKFEKYVICNGAGKRVQVTAWGTYMSKLSSLELGHIVHINSLKYNVPKNQEYNSGNVVFELLVGESTEVTDYGEYEGAQEELAPEEVSLLEAYQKVGNKIKVEGLIKTEPALYVNQGYKANVASLTDTFQELEMKLNLDLNLLKKKLLKGASVQVVGTMEQSPPGPPVLRIDRVDDIVTLDRDRVGFLEILKGFRTKGNE